MNFAPPLHSSNPPDIIFMTILTRVENCPDRSQAVSGMAYFAGTGPPGATCGNCMFYGNGRKGFERRCRKFQEMAHKWGSNLCKFQSGCKYFELKPKPTPKAK